MEGSEASRYWCHMCSLMVNPVVEMEAIKCPICRSGFVEEMASATAASPRNELGSDSDRALSLWAPILLGMMGNPRIHRQLNRMELEDNNVDDEDGNHGPNDEDVDSMMMVNRMSRRRRRRRSPAAIMQLLQGIRAGMLSQSEAGNDTDRDGGRRMILINPFNQTIIIQGFNDSSNELYMNRAAMGDYFIGPGLDLLLQRLAENDPSRYGTPPAGREAVDALPTVRIEEAMQCCVCLDECEVGAEVKEMPCKHKFHSSCIISWLELHSSCPVCRYQLPADDESKLHPDVSRNSSSNQESAHNSGEDNISDNGRRFSVPLVWPFSSLFASSGGGNSSLGSPSTNAPPTTSRADEN